MLLSNAYFPSNMGIERTRPSAELKCSTRTRGFLWFGLYPTIFSLQFSLSWSNVPFAFENDERISTLQSCASRVRLTVIQHIAHRAHGDTVAHCHFVCCFVKCQKSNTGTTNGAKQMIFQKIVNNFVLALSRVCPCVILNFRGRELIAKNAFYWKLICDEWFGRHRYSTIDSARFLPHRSECSTKLQFISIAIEGENARECIRSIDIWAVGVAISETFNGFFEIIFDAHQIEMWPTEFCVSQIRTSQSTNHGLICIAVRHQ